MERAYVDPGLTPFSNAGYEILDREIDTRREVAIWSADPLAPRLGDLFTLESHGVVHEVAVVQLDTFKGGWSVVCRVSDVF